MALSNMLNEPRRELTETGVGLLVVAPIIAADAWFALWFPQYCCIADYQKGSWIVDIILAAIIGLIGMFLVVGFLALIAFGIHQVGEATCDVLQGHGIHLRPRKRQ